MPKRAVQPVTGHPTVLVVDDDHRICELAAVLLKNQGYRCEVATTPDQARVAIREQPLALCLCGLSLGSHSGFELAQEIAIITSATSGAGRHVERMSAYCRMLAQRLGIPGPRAALVQTASLLHDIGKLGIPDRILSKPAKLTHDERREMQAHTTLGHKLLAGSSSELVELAATIALTHHERSDGRGYPYALRRDEIPVEGRVAAVCDVFDALTSSRAYRARPFSVDEAMAIMRAERGGAFDPDILDTFFDALEDVERIRSTYADNNVLSAA